MQTSSGSSWVWRIPRSMSLAGNSSNWKKFQHTLADVSLQRYLLDVDPTNIEDAVDTGHNLNQVEHAKKSETARPDKEEIRAVQIEENTMDRDLSMPYKLTQRYMQETPQKKVNNKYLPPKDSGNEEGWPLQPG